MHSGTAQASIPWEGCKSSDKASDFKFPRWMQLSKLLLKAVWVLQGNTKAAKLKEGCKIVRRLQTAKRLQSCNNVAVQAKTAQGYQRLLKATQGSFYILFSDFTIIFLDLKTPSKVEVTLPLICHRNLRGFVTKCVYLYPTYPLFQQFWLFFVRQWHHGHCTQNNVFYFFQRKKIPGNRILKIG